MIDETLSKDDVQRGDTIEFTAYYQDTTECTCCGADRSFDFAKGSRHIVNHVEGDELKFVTLQYDAWMHGSFDVDVEVKEAEFVIHYRLINDPHRYKHSLFEAVS